MFFLVLASMYISLVYSAFLFLLVYCVFPVSLIYSGVLQYGLCLNYYLSSPLFYYFNYFFLLTLLYHYVNEMCELSV